MLFVELERYFAVELAARKTEVHNLAGKELLKLSESANDARFFHLLLQQSFSAKKQFSESSLSDTVKRLKKAFPETLTFIFWDKNGNVLNDLSDDKRFGFLLKKLNVLMKNVQHDTFAGLHSQSSFAEKYDKDLRLLRQFLGPFVTTEALTSPFVDNSHAECIELHGRGTRVLGWFRALADFSVFAFVSDRIKGRLIGPRLLNSQLATRIPGVTFCLLDEFELRVSEEQPGNLSGQILLNFGKFRRLAANEQLESDHHYFSFQKLNQRWWAVAIMNKESLNLASARAGQVVAMLIAVLAIISLILYCYFLVHDNPLHSVRARLVLIFVYIVFIPALIFTVIGIDYIKQKEKQGFTDQAARSSQLLSSIDQQFNGFIHERAAQLNRRFSKTWPGTAPIDEDAMASMAVELHHDFAPDTIAFSNRSGTDILKKAYARTIKDDFLRKTGAKELLSYLNSYQSGNYDPADGIANGFALSFNMNHQKFMPFAHSNNTYFSYLNTLRDPKNQSFAYLIQIFWPEWQLHEEYFRSRHTAARGGDNQMTYIYFPGQRRAYPSIDGFPELQGFFENVRQNGPAQQRIQDRHGNSYLVFGQAGSHLSSAILAVGVRVEQLDRSIAELKHRLWFLAGLSLIMTLSLFHLLTHYLILPIRELAAGVEMVKNRSYTHRIAVPFNNEFGRLGQSINRSLENLQELEIAKTVQESLLPQSSLDLGQFLVFARTRAMTTLGGDYFDFVVDRSNNATILMADVAGHGVQAALLMAMAKSVLMLNSSGSVNPEALMEALNRTFVTLRKSDISTMMTGQIMQISDAGSISYTNAGHCPPLIVSENGKSVTELSHPSLPFGFSLNRKFSTISLKTQPGDAIILYSDGILECENKDGVALGDTGFREMAGQCFTEDPAGFIDNLYRAYDGYTESQQDDITFVLIKHKETKA